MTLKLVSDEPEESPELIEQIRGFQLPLRKSLDQLLERIGDAQFVLLGESAPGISDATLWRTLISRRLIEEKGFSFIALDADWSSAYQANRYVKSFRNAASNARSALSSFQSWPTWMHANKEMIHFLEWLHAFNQQAMQAQKVGIYGLDIYGLWESLQTLHEDLDDREGQSRFSEIFHCFQPFGTDHVDPIRSPILDDERMEALVKHLRKDLSYRSLIAEGDGLETHFQAEQQALVMKNAEAYYRTLLHARSSSWNLRDSFMMDTLDRLMAFYGNDAKAIIWLDNTHLGDARFTALADAGEVNIGQLHRERHGAENVVLVGFSSYSGEVLTSKDWGTPAQTVRMPEARMGSWDAILHEVSSEDKLLIFDRAPKTPEMHQLRGQRAIGVVYNPDRDFADHYVPTILAERYDALIYIDQCQAIHPVINSRQPRTESEEIASTAM